jgi:prepilin-type N-terminal cleavage/methylation domain-containing protein
MHARATRCAGFTLIETLAALALASIIVVAASALVHQGLFTFDHGAEAVDQEEELSLAMSSLRRDFAAVRYVRKKSLVGATPPSARTVEFIGQANADGQPDIIFVTGGGRATGVAGEEIVGLSVEEGDSVTKLIRRRAPWTGPMQQLASATLHDPVVLLRGNIAVSFSYSQLAPNGTLVWRDRWANEAALPHSVRLTLADGDSGADLQTAEFLIRANAPASCASGADDCLPHDPGIGGAGR